MKNVLRIHVVKISSFLFSVPSRIDIFYKDVVLFCGLGFSFMLGNTYT
jgi:hypothetical protein